MGLTCSPLYFRSPATFLPSTGHPPARLHPVAQSWFVAPRRPFSVRSHPFQSTRLPPAARSFQQPPALFYRPSAFHQNPVILPSGLSDASPPDHSLLLPASQPGPNAPARLTRRGGTTRQNVSPVTALQILT
jgi:hypothetical protein